MPELFDIPIDRLRQTYIADFPAAGSGSTLLTCHALFGLRLRNDTGVSKTFTLEIGNGQGGFQTRDTIVMATGSEHVRDLRTPARNVHGMFRTQISSAADPGYSLSAIYWDQTIGGDRNEMNRFGNIDLLTLKNAFFSNFTTALIDGSTANGYCNYLSSFRFRNNSGSSKTITVEKQNATGSGYETMDVYVIPDGGEGKRDFGILVPMPYGKLRLTASAAHASLTASVDYSEQTVGT